VGSFYQDYTLYYITRTKSQNVWSYDGVKLKKRALVTFLPGRAVTWPDNVFATCPRQNREADQPIGTACTHDCRAHGGSEHTRAYFFCRPNVSGTQLTRLYWVLSSKWRHVDDVVAQNQAPAQELDQEQPSSCSNIYTEKFASIPRNRLRKILGTSHRVLFQTFERSFWLTGRSVVDCSLRSEITVSPPQVALIISINFGCVKKQHWADICQELAGQRLTLRGDQTGDGNYEVTMSYPSHARAPSQEEAPRSSMTSVSTTWVCDGDPCSETDGTDAAWRSKTNDYCLLFVPLDYAQTMG